MITETTEKKYDEMTVEEKIAFLKERIYLIEVGTDYMTHEDWNAVHKFQAEIKELEASKC